MELPFLDITLRISDARIQTSVYYTHNYLNLTSFYPHHCKNILSLTASFSGFAAFTLMVMTPFCDQGRLIHPLLTVVIPVPLPQTIYKG